MQNEWTHDSERKFGKISAQSQAEMVIIIKQEKKTTDMKIILNDNHEVLQ